MSCFRNILSHLAFCIKYILFMYIKLLSYIESQRQNNMMRFSLTICPCNIPYLLLHLLFLGLFWHLQISMLCQFQCPFKMSTQQLKTDVVFSSMTKYSKEWLRPDEFEKILSLPNLSKKYEVWMLLYMVQH
jgi:hypothetical protein